ncbi:hypothetical protein SAMN05216553_107396 [Lentzea fradiae]|uniref:Nuclear transport factor 2 family protein n=1 Tax=Lentzea fradiae TaxID=200378 RepID=A0A1G7TPJ5_9PSEU|nr:hypothetical protein [Lentzea fradiae]SDG37205.1 hypothetical protein SAMN05216553_107396 [Lentzea fradiae]
MRAAVLALVPVLLAGASATPVALADPDRGEIARIAQLYLENRAHKVTTAPQTPGFGVPVTPALAARLAVHEEELASAAAKRTRYRSAVVRTMLRRIDADQNHKIVVAHVHEHGELYFEKPGPVRSTGYGLPHLLTFVRAGEGWVLADVALRPPKHCGLLPEPQQVSEC